jgi:hypothetical protein
MQSIIIKPAPTAAGSTACAYADWQLRYATASIAFCYRARFDPTRLRDALQHVLADFSEYTGKLRMDAGTLRIDRGAGGARLELHERKESFESLARAAEQAGGHLLCPVVSSRRAPLLALRLTDTVDGCVLGVSWHHSVGDLQSTLVLLRAVSNAYRGEPWVAPQQVDDRAQYLQAHMPDSVGGVSALRLCRVGELFSLVPFLLQRKRRVDVTFSFDELAEIRDGVPRQGFVSSYDALCAHVLGVLHELTPERPVERLVLGVNYRKRVGLPPNLIGNTLSTISVQHGTEVATALRTMLEQYAKRHADYHATCRFLAAHPGRFQRLRAVPTLVDTSGRSWILTNAAGFGVYELELGGALPALFCVPMAAPLPLMTVLLERPNRAGITLSMHLPKALATRIDSPEGHARMHTYPRIAGRLMHTTQPEYASSPP